MANTLFQPLEKSIVLLLVDDDPVQLGYYEDMLSGHPAYSVISVATARHASEFLQADNPPHLCIIDLGIDDVADDEFYLLKKFGKKLPVIIMSGSADMERAFSASQLGAAGMVAKPPDMVSIQFWEQLASIFLNKAILPDIDGQTNSVLEICCRVLSEDLPENVSDWARKTNITDTYLRKLWMECFSCSPKHILFVYKFYKSALKWFNEHYVADLNDCESKLSQHDFPGYAQQLNYYLVNKRILDRIRDKNQIPAGVALPATALIDV